MRKYVLALLVLTVSVCSLSAGPFGIDMGMSLEQLEAAGMNPEMIGPSLYTVDPSSKHAAFRLYAVWVDPEEGVYMIKALGKDIDTSKYGTALKSKFNEIESALSNTYGSCERIQFLMPGSIWDEPDDWMMALKLEERIHISEWEKGSSGTRVPDDCSTIILAAAADSSSEGHLILEYYGADHDRLTEKRKSAEAKVF